MAENSRHLKKIKGDGSQGCRGRCPFRPYLSYQQCHEIRHPNVSFNIYIATEMREKVDKSVRNNGDSIVGGNTAFGQVDFSTKILCISLVKAPTYTRIKTTTSDKHWQKYWLRRIRSVLLLHNRTLSTIAISLKVGILSLHK
jgi:hypothetical protein